MVTFIPNRYNSPKWQAYVTPEDKAFVFGNGYAVRSLYELKQALATLPEDIIMHHFKEDGNDIINWVEFVVKDKDLAEALKKYNHRWGMIVALERQMMRTLNFPSYLAERYLSKAEISFTFASGEEVHSLPELADALQKVSEETVDFHLERTPNDIAKWVLDIIGDYQLAELLEEASHKDQMHRFVLDHVEMLKEAA